MPLNRISAAEAASLIKHGYNIGLSGFTPAGTAKAVTAELAKIAEAEHAKGNPFQVGIFTGASTGESCDGILSRAKAIRYRAPYTTNADFRKAVNNGEIAYNDIHLSQMAQEVRYGFMGKVNVAIIEACEVTPDGKIYLTAAGGIAPTICRLADQIIIELNSAHSKSGMGLHDVYEPLDPPYRREIPIYKPSDRIGLPYVQVDPKKNCRCGGNQLAGRSPFFRRCRSADRQNRAERGRLPCRGYETRYHSGYIPSVAVGRGKHR